ncbi:ornithine cyclodeaminase [Halobacteriales archaeon QS_5_70_15]|nr:MAG: ornithine cyclodeaminase [Halobacteriales archaeon QS_5_70_15]
MRVLTEEDVLSLVDLETLLPELESAFVSDYRGEVERPDRPHFPVGAGLDGREEPTGTGLTMSAYVHGAPYLATKLATVHEGNPDRGLPTVRSQLALSDAETGEPLAFMNAAGVTNARTGGIGGLAAKHLASGGVVGVLGAGVQARWQTRAVEAARGTDEVRVYSPSDSREACAADLRGEDIDARSVDSPREAVAGADVVVTATTSTEPVFPADALDAGALVVAVGSFSAELRELSAAVFERADRVFADVPEEVAGIGDLRDTGLEAADLTPLGAVFAGDDGRGSPEEIPVVESVGTAVLDAAAGEYVYDAAVEADVGVDVPL